MKTKQFIKELKKLDNKDFDYMYAYTDRKTGKYKNLFGRPLEEVLPICKVCVSGYFLSLNGFSDTSAICSEYGFTTKQLDAIILPECEVTFYDGIITTPNRKANLEEVIDYVENLFSKEDFITDNFSLEESIEF